MPLHAMIQEAEQDVPPAVRLPPVPAVMPRQLEPVVEASPPVRHRAAHRLPGNMHRIAPIAPVLFVASCAVPTDGYLKSITVSLPVSETSEVTDTLTPGKMKAGEESGPFPSDFPPCRTIVFKDPRPYPSFDQPRYALPAVNVLRFYDLRGVADDGTIRSYVRRLNRALSQRPTARELEASTSTLPDYPPRNAGHLVQERVAYHDFSWGRGIFYLVVFTQGPGNYPNNEELTYLFQGLSHDGKVYVSCDFRVTHSILPDTIDRIPEYDDIDDKAQEIARALDRQSDATFEPDLEVIRGWVASISINQGEPQR